MYCGGVMNPLFVLTLNGNHTKTTREEFVSGLQAKGATVTMAPSRLGNFDVVRVNGQPVARAFASQAEMMAYMIDRN